MTDHVMAELSRELREEIRTSRASIVAALDRLATAVEQVVTMAREKAAQWEAKAKESHGHDD